MSVTLSESLSFCQVDGHLVFLDLYADRYFSLPERLERRVIALLDSQSHCDAAELIWRSIPLAARGKDCNAKVSTIPPPSKSAGEQGSPVSPTSFFVLVEVLGTVFTTQLQLKLRRLRHIIDGLTRDRERRTTFSRTENMLAAVRSFAAARRFVPIDTCCLLDSISLARFLSRRGHPANIVFAVTRDPFSAHCWVQSGPWVLNDTLGNVSAHTPIRIV